MFSGAICVPDVGDCLALERRVAVVTGGTRGIGLAVAEGLVERGLTVVVVGSDAQQGVRAVEQLRRARLASRRGNETADPHFMQADLSSISAIGELGRSIERRHPAVHYLIHNAAVVTAHRSLTVDGIESQMMVNHLAPYLLTRQLMGALDQAECARIIVTSSQVERGAQLDLDDLNHERRHEGTQVYAATKLANLFFCYALARRLALRSADPGPGPSRPTITVNALHPGVVRTRLLDHLLDHAPRSPLAQAFDSLRTGVGHVLRRVGALPPVATDWALSPTEGAQTTLATALDGELKGVSGQYFSELHSRESSSQSHDESLQEALWHASARLLGVGADWPSR